MHVQQLGYFFLGLFLGGLLALLGLDGLEHRSDFRDLFPGHLGQDVPVEMEDTTLPVSIRQALVYRLHQPQALVADYKPNPRKAPEARCRRNSSEFSLCFCMPAQTTRFFLYPLEMNTVRHQQVNLAHFASPNPLEPDPVQVQVGVRSLGRLVPVE